MLYWNEHGRHLGIKEIMQLISFPNDALYLIGIDGCGAAGKSTLAEELKRELECAAVVSMDDFYLPSSHMIDEDPRNKPIGADFDWRRLESQVLVPLRQREQARYQIYDWDNDRLAEWKTVVPQGAIIVEGVYVLRTELASYYDFSIWIDCPRKTRLDRGIMRDGEEMRAMWEENWMVAEDRYVREHQPRKRADMILHTTKRSSVKEKGEQEGEQIWD